MALPPPSEHFQGKSVAEHLIEARSKGAFASSEIHGTEMPGYLGAATDGANETCISLLLIWIALSSFALSTNQTLLVFVFFSCGFLLWKVGRSALLGWARLERLHRLTEEERWEIEHHRAQEKEELTELYRAKGFEGKLLEEAIDVLMADDNRLLRVMLEEELGLTLESYEHPLKQSAGAFVGVFLAAALLIASYWMSPVYGIAIGAFCIMSLSSIISAKRQRNHALPAMIWHLAVGAFGCIAAYFLTKALSL
jgi:hypothetical protein